MRKNTRRNPLSTAIKALLCCALVAGLFSPAAATQAAAADAIRGGSTVQITADQAITYSPGTNTNSPNSSYYPLPKGTLDVTTGERLSYKKGNTTYYFYKLRSGQRVSASDVKEVSTAPPSNNRISNLSLRTSDTYTYVVLEMGQKVSYRVKNETNSISFLFQNTTQTPAGQSFNGGLFSGSKWDDDGKLTLTFNTPGSFMGYKAYYEDGDLVLRFRNVPASIADTRIAIDPGHGGKDKGALGSPYNEDEITKQISAKVIDELQSRGATTYLLDGDGYSPQARKEMAEAWEPDFFFSIHCNSATRTAATGTEIYYFHAFNKPMANILAGNVSSRLQTDNRGDKYGIYHVALSSQMRSVLVETGFMSNPGEYQKLISDGYQWEIAYGIADSVEQSLAAINV